MPVDSDANSSSEIKLQDPSSSKLCVESDSHPEQDSSPVFTPSVSPPSEALPLTTEGAQNAAKDLKTEALHARMSDVQAQPSSATVAASSIAKEEIEPPAEDAAAKPEPKVAASTITEGSVKKASCAKHINKKPVSKSKRDEKKKTKKQVWDSSSSEGDSTSTSSSDSSNSGDSETEDTGTESSDSDVEVQKQKRRRKIKTKASKSRRNRKKARSYKLDEESDSGSDETNDEESAEDEKARKKAAKKIKTKKKARRLRSKKESSEDVEEDEAHPDDVAILRAKEKLAALQLKRAGARRLHREGRDSRCKRRSMSESQSDGQRSGSHQKARAKKKRASKVAFKRVDQRKKAP
jgi:hypothetical protein